MASAGREGGISLSPSLYQTMVISASAALLLPFWALDSLILNTHISAVGRKGSSIRMDKTYFKFSEKRGCIRSHLPVCVCVLLYCWEEKDFFI